MTSAIDVETKHVAVGDVSYAYRELRPAHLEDPTPIDFLQRFRGTLDDWDPAFVDEPGHRTRGRAEGGIAEEDDVARLGKFVDECWVSISTSSGR